MSRILSLTIGIIFSLNICGQDTDLDSRLSLKDSILLNEFWTNFKTAIETDNKVMLATLCDFPFSCRPCTDDTTLKHNDHLTIKVTKKIFSKSQYKIFFGKPIKDEVSNHKNFETYIFYPAFDNKNRPNGFMFSYTIIAPSKNWEGLQGFIYLEKINSRYKITGIDTVP